MRSCFQTIFILFIYLTYVYQYINIYLKYVKSSLKNTQQIQSLKITIILQRLSQFLQPDKYSYLIKNERLSHLDYAQISDIMFVKYSLREEILIPAHQYTLSATKSVRNAVFTKYLFRIMKVSAGTSKSTDAICVKIEGIEIVDNIILRKTAEIKVKVLITLVALRLLPDQYLEGTVVRSGPSGVIVSFMGGLLEGTIGIKHMHKDTIYSEESNKWILAAPDNRQGYEWKVGAHARFRVAYTLWDEQQNAEGLQMCDLIHLKADEGGLGPIEWWL